MAIDRTRTLRGALAGAAAAGVWAAQQPVDKRLFGSAYDDVALLGKAITRGPAWYPAGLAVHLQNGAIFGAVYANVAPLGRLTDRFHPAREELPTLTRNPRAMLQAIWRHALFGVVLGELERRLNADREIEFPEYEAVVSPNGHGPVEHAVAAGPASS